MNNSQFRALLDPSSSRRSAASKNGTSPPAQPRVAALGSRTHSSIPMTPRTVSKSGGNDFARQVAEYKRNNSSQSTKKSAARSVPKGTKYAAGYQDRAALLRDEQASTSEDSRDEKGERLKSLEEMVKLQQIDQATFEKLRDEMGIGGGVDTTHMVKGLDWKLLERVKRGEDITAKVKDSVEPDEDADDPPGTAGGELVDSELETVLHENVAPVERQEKVKKGTTSSQEQSNPDLSKMSRNEILKHLRSSRAAAEQEAREMAPTEPEIDLGSKFRKIGSDNSAMKTKFIEKVNGRRREILTITNPDGTTKRKVRWIDKESMEPERKEAVIGLEVMGMEVPAAMIAKQKAILEREREAEDGDDDIFADVGAEYDPIGDDSDHSDSGTNDEKSKQKEETQEDTGQAEKRARNYFSTKDTEDDEGNKPKWSELDPDIMAAFKRAATLRKAQENDQAGENGGPSVSESKGQEFLEKLKKREREDARDLDLGFGESRFGDEEDEDGPVWNEEEGEGKKAARRRGPKKRKGNKDNVSDVMAVMNSRKK